ncbi:phosphoglycerate mutase-like protein [Viridothelium virens]|uniref:Phosphoglycerate mutase-like protein n=1 Tax=Viridothelium virens TaxID=1048519 RepID=A0A6A6GSF4_VIRVR|nr:phosphoglycerate mutase-like protein [Viridothelium virens]
MLDTIYVVRHGFRSNWVVDPKSGKYTNNIRSPTGIDGDPALTSYGVEQSKQLAQRLTKMDDPIETIYSSPFYRCVQTLKPFIQGLYEEGSPPGSSTVKYEHGLGEWFGIADFEHPQPVQYEVLQAEHFPFLAQGTLFGVIPNPKGESIAGLHDRVARILNAIIQFEDRRPEQPRALLICTHAAVMIAIGRVLTGHMPADPNEEDFRCGTCSLSEYKRKSPLRAREEWQDWENGIGIAGGWDVALNGDCSYLSNGEERTW